MRGALFSLLLADMKVLVCIPCLLTGGTEIQTLSLVEALVGSGHEVVTLCYFEHSEQMEARYRNAGAKVVKLSPDGVRPNGIVSVLKLLFNGLRQALRSERPDVVHVQYMAPGAIPIILLRLLGAKRIIATAHTSADIYPSLRLLHALQRRIKAFTCITELAERSFFGSSQLYNIDTVLKKRGNHFTIYNNLPSYIALRTEPREFNAANVTIGVVSRLEHIKGMDLVVPAFEKIHTAYPSTRLLVVGDGGARSDMERQVSDAGLVECATFVGRQPQDVLQSYYDKIDILLMPSRSEGFGLTAVEGMARGCVVVASVAGGLPEVVADGDAGLLHRIDDTYDMAAKVLSLLASSDVVPRYSQRAVHNAARFSAENYNRLIANLYSKI